ncbi:MAG: hypothetical protein JWO11_4395 [Nocardioides sp.]|nr:hypothetical protein [Nocardioides sp.]
MESAYVSVEQVLDGLGDKVVDALTLMVAQVRDDMNVFRRTFPAWAADSTDRGWLNFAHDRAWAHLTRLLDDVDEVSFVDQTPTREFYVGTLFRLRVKKHDAEGEVSSYPTLSAKMFMVQAPATFDGLEEVRLVAGYRWDAELRRIGPPVISLHDGADVIWVHELDEPADPQIVSAVPIVPAGGPTPPQIVVGDAIGEKTDTVQEGRSS